MKFFYRSHTSFMVFLAALATGVAIQSTVAIAQTFPPPPVSTKEWSQDFSTLSAGPWVDNVDSDKEKDHPTNANVVTSCTPSSPDPNTTSRNCFKVIYNHNGGQAGILKQPPSSPVLATGIAGAPGAGSGGNNPSSIGWVAAVAATTNTGTDVTQENINISANTTGSEKYTATAVPSYAYTLSYDVYFEPGFDFAKGGKLPGLASLTFDSGCTEDGSAKRTPSNWSERVMWRENGRIELYSYDQSRPSGNCGIDELVDAQPGDAAYEYPETAPGDTKFRMKAGVWYTITISVAVNDNNAVLYATDANGATLLDSFGDPIVIGGNGLVYLGIKGADGSQGSIQYNNVALRDECDAGSSSDWSGSAPVCPTPVTDSAASRVNDVFFSTFFGGNETKRLTCLNPTFPSNSPSGTNQIIYNELCASQVVAYIWPTNTWVPQTISAADFTNLAVYNGYEGLTGTPPTAPANLAANPIDSGEIDLSWNASTATAPATLVGYKVYSNGGILLGQTSNTAFPVTNIAGVALSASTPYYFFVKAYDSTGNQSGFSNEAYTTTPTSAPASIYPPGSVTTAVLPPGNAVTVFWAPQSNAASYQVYRNGSAVGAPVLPATACGLIPAQQSYVDTGLGAGTAYTYTVTASDAAGHVSAQSLPSTATPSTAGAATNFAVSVTPPYCAAVAAGSSATYSVNVTAAPSATLALVASNPNSSDTTATALDYGALYSALPAGVSATFGPITNNTSTMTVTTTASTPAGIYPLNLTATSGGVTNWTQAVLTVTATPPTNVTVTANNTTMVAGTTPPTPGYTLSPMVTLSTNPQCTTSVTSSSPAGTYTGANTCTGAVGTNDTFTYVAGTMTVTAAQPTNVTVTANNLSMTYGSAVPTRTYTLSPVVTLSTNPQCTTTATSTSPVGTYPITCSGAVQTGDTFTYVQGTLTVTPATVTVTANNLSMVQGSSVPTLTATLNPNVTPTTLPKCTTTASSSSAPGTYPITCTGAALANYTFTYVNGTMTVTASSGTLVIITANSQTIESGAAIPTLTYILTPSATLTTNPKCTTTATASSPTGSYPITCAGAVGAGYNFYYAPGSTLTISSKSVDGTITVTASNQTMSVGGPLPTFTYTVNPSGSSLATKPTCSTTATTSSPAGTYPITCEGAAKSKENITYVPGFLTVD